MKKERTPILLAALKKPASPLDAITGISTGDAILRQYLCGSRGKFLNFK